MPDTPRHDSRPDDSGSNDYPYRHITGPLDDSRPDDSPAADSATTPRRRRTQDDSAPVPGSVTRHGIKPWLEHQLCRDLAAGEKTRAALAREHQVTRPAISAFARRHARKIDEIKANLADEFAGLWAAAKASRIAAYQRDLERISDHTHHEWVKARTAILHNIAEELGQLPPRAQAVTAEVRHILEGVSLTDLQ